MPHNIEFINTLHDIEKLVSSFSDITSYESLIENIKTQIEKVAPNDTTGMYLIDERENTLKLFYAKGFSFEEMKEAENTAMERHPGHVYRTGEVLWVKDQLTENNPFSIDSRKNSQTRSRVYVPVKLKDQIIGVFGIQSKEPNAFTERHLAVLKVFAALAADSYSLIKQNQIITEINTANERLSILARSSFNNVIFTDKDGKITYVNAAFERNTGWHLSEIMGKKPGSFLVGLHTEKEKTQELREAIQNRVPCNTTITNYTKDAQEYKVKVQLNPVFDEHGELLSFVSIQQDVTKEEQQKEILTKARLELQENYESMMDLKEQYADIVQTTDELITSLDPHGNILFVNHSWLKKTGYLEHEILGTNIFTYIHPDSQKHCTEIFQRIHAGGTSQFLIDYAIVAKNGNRVELEGSANLIFKDGNLLYIRSHLRDVTEFNRAAKEKALQTEKLAKRNQILAELSIIDFQQYPNNKEIYKTVTEALANGLDVARVGIWHYHDHQISCDDLFEFPLGRHSDGIILHESDFAPYFEAIKTEMAIVADDANTHPASGCFSSSYLTDFGISAIMDFPFRSNNNLKGVVCCEHVGGIRKWTDDDIAFGRAIADMLAVIEESRKRLELEKTFGLLFDKSADPILLLDEQLKCMDCNDSTLKLLGFEDKVFFLGREPHEFFPEKQSDGTLSLDKLNTMNAMALKQGSCKFEFDYLKVHGDSVTVEVMMTLTERFGEKFYYTVWRDVTDRITAQMELVESQSRLESIMNSLNETVWGIRLPDHTLQYISPSAELLYELPNSDWHTNVNLWFDVIHPEDQPRVQMESASLFINGKANMEYRILTPDKKEKWIFSNCQIIKDENGIPVLMTGISGDITARKTTEIELQNYKIAIDDSAIVSITDNLGFITYANDKFTKISQYSMAELIGKNHRFINSGYHPKAFFVEMWETLNRGEIWKGEIKNKAKDGSFYWVDSTIVPFIKDGKPYQFVAIRYDMTQRVEAKNDIEEQKLFYENILNNIPGNVVVFSEDGKYLFLNPNTVKDPVLREWLIGKDNYDYCRYRNLSMDLADGREKEFAALRANGYSINSTEKRLQKDGKYAYLNSTMNLYTYKGEKYIVAYGLDITALKEAEDILNGKNEELLLINKKLEQLARDNQELEQYAYLASHDLKEPLRTVENYIQLLKEDYTDQLDEQAQKYLGTIVSSIGRMNKLIKTLLEFSRLGVNRVLSFVDSGHLVSEVLLDLDSLIKDSNASIHVSEMPLLNLFESEMRQLFQNLIANAIKFRKKDVNPVIHIQSEKIMEGWKFSVRDNGIGISPEHFKRVFEIFQRLHTVKQYEGSGIGLANCKKIVQLHFGEIWVDSKIGEGSTFYFTIQNL